jgi:hypothetical protein
MADKVRHILSLSGGKDSTALAVYMKDRVPEMEYAFCDTGDELRETYEYLDRLEAYLGKPIERLNPDRPFRHYLELYNGVLPDARTRWCTRMLKLRPFEKYIGDSRVISYVGIRADEMKRKGYVTTKDNVTARYPFIEDGKVHSDIVEIVNQSGLGLPDYYKWRSRSGCYFCFFQQKNEWVGLLENHPDLFKRAADFEKYDPLTGERFTWSPGESLEEIAEPERIVAIKMDFMERSKKLNRNISGKLMDLLVEESDNSSCLVCHL